jgi:DNA polymerase
MSAPNENYKTAALKALAAQVELGQDEIILSQVAEPVAADTPINNDLPAAETETANSEEKIDTNMPYKSIDTHRRAICKCMKCSLGETRNKFVYGVGSPDADLMLVGEAPGANEDAQGEPFVGRGGQLLDKILAAIDLSRETVYIANILKCRPPANRDPQPDEMALCFPYLEEQVRLIKPKLICALGRIAAQALLETKTPLGKLRGEFHSYQGVPLLVTYHPAALLRFQAYKKDTWEDMQLLKKRLDQLTTGKKA